MLTEGSETPTVVLTNQNDESVDLTTFRGKSLLVYFYPKANTPGCTQQTCLLNDIRGQVGDTVIIGISPDSPKAQRNFATKYGIGFDLLSDPDHAVAEAFGVWKEKKNYGKTYMGIERSAFLVGPDGRIRQAWYKISPKDTPVKLLAALRT
jgi:thioredoxin-dependent peroxiredoxin